jgi:hypothetical protein
MTLSLFNLQNTWGIENYKSKNAISLLYRGVPVCWFRADGPKFVALLFAYAISVLWDIHLII